MPPSTSFPLPRSSLSPTSPAKWHHPHPTTRLDSPSWPCWYLHSSSSYTTSSFYSSPNNNVFGTPSTFDGATFCSPSCAHASFIHAADKPFGWEESPEAWLPSTALACSSFP
ncbi:unnamed protein product [Pleuronectes platessa]|uniref:Uncharacterized protein n=1 Tax=Pleuronectes platessa TaxID=8262 RepID=A0A9N7UHI5_PLEPL|nr:unnamed protein product [Pleuronectes platessa]